MSAAVAATRAAVSPRPAPHARSILPSSALAPGTGPGLQLLQGPEEMRAIRVASPLFGHDDGCRTSAEAREAKDPPPPPPGARDRAGDVEAGQQTPRRGGWAGDAEPGGRIEAGQLGREQRDAWPVRAGGTAG